MEEFNAIAVRMIIKDMNAKMDVCVDVSDYNHNQLVDIYNEIASSNHEFVKVKYNSYFHQTLIVCN